MRLSFQQFAPVRSHAFLYCQKFRLLFYGRLLLRWRLLVLEETKSMIAQITGKILMSRRFFLLKLLRLYFLLLLFTYCTDQQSYVIFHYTYFLVVILGFSLTLISQQIVFPHVFFRPCVFKTFKKKCLQSYTLSFIKVNLVDFSTLVFLFFQMCIRLSVFGVDD